jgi:hypothetical protein
MIIINEYQIKIINKTLKKLIPLIITASPCCQSQLRFIGTRKRKYIDEYGNKKTIILRRLRCTNCQKIHLELPDFLVPYKRHCESTVEQCIDTPKQDCCACCEESTVYKIKKWFKNMTSRFEDCLRMRRARFPLPNDSPGQPKVEPRQGVGWLKNLVWDLVNHYLWPYTRSELASPFV